MRNPFSKRSKSTSDADCCSPLTFEGDPVGAQQTSTDCCAPFTLEDQAADTSLVESEVPARDVGASRA